MVKELDVAEFVEGGCIAAGVRVGDAIANKLSSRACPRRGPVGAGAGWTVAWDDISGLLLLETIGACVGCAEKNGGWEGSGTVATELMEAEELSRANKSFKDCIPPDSEVD